MKIITLTIKENKAFINSPYHADLIEAIKEIHYSARKWESPNWVVDLSQTEKSTRNNLEYLREICNRYAEETGWLFVDKTQPETINIEEIHYDLLINVLDKLPNYSLSLTSWQNQNKHGLKNILQIQLDIFLDNKELFNELKNASLSIWKKNFAMCGFGFHEKDTMGAFSFKVLANLEIIQKLGAMKTKYLQIIKGKITNSFKDEFTIHAQDNNDNLYIGYPIEKFDHESVKFSNSSWQLLIQDEQIYFIESVEEIFDYYCKKGQSFFWIGRIGHAIGSNDEIVSRKFHELHLDEWLEDKILSLSTGEITPPKWSNRKFTLSEYTHPFDIVSENANKFTWQDEGKDFLNTTTTKIKAQKQELINQEIAKKTAEITENAEGYSDNFLKVELASFARKFGVEFKKSWAKPILITALCEKQEWVDYLVEKFL